MSLHLSSSVSDMGALTTNTARLVGEVRSAVVGTATDAALVPQFAPLSIRPFAIDTNPLVPIHWSDAPITGSMHREGVYTTDVAPGAMKPTYQPNRYGLPAVLFTDDAERLSVDLRGNNTPRMVSTTVFLVIDISNLVNNGVVLQSVASNQTTTAGSIQLDVKKDQTLHLYQYPYRDHIDDPTAGDTITTTTTYTVPYHTIMVIAFRVVAVPLGHDRR